MKLFLCMCALMLCIPSCKEEREHHGYVMLIPEESREAAIKFVAACIKDANPRSDEEPEDMIRQCEKTAKNMFGICTKINNERRHYTATWCSLPVKQKGENK